MKTQKLSFKDLYMKYQTIVLFVLMIIVYSILSPSFFTAVNLRNVFSQNASLIIVSMAQLLPQILNGVDLSVSAVVAFAGTTTALLMTNGGMGFFAAAIVAVALSACFGAINGFLVSRCAFAPFIGTLATTQIAKGVCYVISNANIIYVEEPTFAFIGNGWIAGIPTVVVIAVVIVLIMAVILTRTIVGRKIMAIGGNEETARIAGIKVKRYKFLVYTAAGALAGIAGVLAACRLGAGSPTIGAEWEMDSIAAVVIGGTYGGYGSAINTFLGALIIGWMKNILNLIGLASYPQFIIKGLIIILAVMGQKLGTGDVVLFKKKAKN